MKKKEKRVHSQDVPQIPDELIAMLREKSFDDLAAELNAIISAEEEEVILSSNVVGAYIQVIEEKTPVVPEIDVDDELRRFHARLATEPAQSLVPEPSPPKRKRFSSYRWSRRAGTFVAVIMLFVLCGTAFAHSWPKIKVLWEQEALIIGANDSGQTELPMDVECDYRSLDEALEVFGLSGNNPKWIPSDYAINSIETSEADGRITVFAIYSTPDGKELVIRILCAMPSKVPKLVYEKIIGSENVYTSHEEDFQITDNIEEMRCTWQIEDQNIFGSISGDISREQLERMINSIFEE